MLVNHAELADNVLQILMARATHACPCGAIAHLPGMGQVMPNPVLAPPRHYPMPSFGSFSATAM